jgi:single-strand DNA-binding protein
MSGYCSVVVVGNLGKEPEIRSTGSGKKVASFSVAVDQGFGDSKKTEWVNIIAWEKLAEFAEKYLKKGKTIALSGTLQTSSWEDKASGQKRYKTEVVARDITFMDTRSSEGGQSRSNTAQPRQQAAPQARAEAMADPFIDPDDIPF